MRLTPDLDRKTASLSGLTLDAQGDVAGVKALALKLEAKKLLYSPGNQVLELDTLKLALSGRRGSDPFELALDWPQLAVDAQRLQGSALSGRFKLAGPTALAGTLRCAAPSGRFDSLRLPGVAATLAGSAGQRKINGNAKADVVLRLGPGAVAFERLEATASIADAGRPPLQLALRGHAGADGRGAQWALEGALNANRFDSSGSAAFGAGIPSLKASARFDSLDLNQLLAPDKPPAAEAPAALPADSAVPFDALRSVNGQFTLAAGALAYRQFRIAEARLDAALDNGALRVSRLAGRAWSGSFDASGSADARNRRVTARLVASGVNVNALLKDVAGKDLLEGSGRVSAELASSGATLGALRANLAGKVALQIRDGAIKGINLARSLRQAKAALSLKQDALTQARATEKTDFSELSASAQIADGIAHSDDLDLKSPFLRIGGAGRVDIGRSSIDYTARASVVAAPGGQDAGELAALRGLTVPVRLTGPLEAIDWKIQWSAVAAAAVQSKLKQKLAEQLGTRLGTAPANAASAPAKPSDKLKDALKGFFK